MLVDVRIMPLAVVALTLVACGPIDGTTTADRPMSAPGTREETTVTRVVDGDTIHVSLDGDDVTIRLIGIDTPEVYGHVDCYGPQASAFTDRLLKPGTHVRYEIGRETHDVYGRTLAYLWLDNGRMFNELLAENGYARTLTIPPNDEYARLFAAAAQSARAARRGLWGDC